jgi:hypothetical protein
MGNDMSTVLRHGMRATAALLVAGVVAHAGVIRVPGNYLNIQVAVNNAVDGDVILIAPGSYKGPVDIGSKTLTLVVDGGGKAGVPRLTIHDLAGNQSVVVRGLGGDGIAFANGPHSEGLVLARNDGHVRIEGATFRGSPGTNILGAPSQHPGGWPAARVFDCLSVAFTHCTFTGGYGASVGDEENESFPGSGGAGLLATDSFISVTGCTLTGGEGGVADDTISYGGGSGGAGIKQLGGTLCVSGSSLTGSHGGHGDCSFFACGAGGDGGDGIFVDDDGRLCFSDDIFVAGKGGSGGGGSTGGASPGDDGIDGKGIDAHAGDTVTNFFTPARDLTAGAPVREGHPLQLHFAGQPGDGALAWISLHPRWELLPSHSGVFLVDNGQVLNVLLALGPTDASGALDVSLLVPELGPGIDGLPLHVQGLFLDAQGTVRLGAASNSVLLDSAY